MRNIITHLRRHADLEVMSLASYREESWRGRGKIAYFLAREVARLLLALKIAFRPRGGIYYTWDWFLARDLALVSLFRRLDFILEANGLHSFESELRGHFPRGSIMHRLYVCRAERRAARAAALVISVSAPLADTVSALYSVPREKFAVAHNAADPDLFPFTPPVPVRDELVVGWAGSFQPYEGFRHLIDAAALLHSRNRAVRFVIVGDGAARKEYEREIDTRGLASLFDFRGRTQWEKVPAELAPAHCCIMLPDLSDVGREYRRAIGITQMKTYEYMALGKPVLTWDLGDARTVIQEAGVGFVCEPSADALCPLIERMFDEQLAPVGLRGRQLVESEYNWTRTAEAILNAVRSLPK